MIYVLFANGFEEIEGLTPVDILRRAELDVTMVGVGSDYIAGAHGMNILCEAEISQVDFSDAEMLILPGGMPGTLNLEKNLYVKQAIKDILAADKTVGAICAAPSILGHMGLLDGKKAVCYPGFEDQLIGAEYTDEDVVKDGNIITSRGVGTAISFSLELLKVLTSKERAEIMAEGIEWKIK